MTPGFDKPYIYRHSDKILECEIRFEPPKSPTSRTYASNQPSHHAVSFIWLTSAVICRPMCEMTAANMAYRGDQGLATSGTEALILLYCNTVIHPCSDCFTIQGPSTSSAQLLQDSQSGTTHGSRFSLHLQWQSGYLGNVSVIVDQTR